MVKRELEQEGEIGLLDLALDRTLRRQEQVLGELLGQGRAALHNLVGLRVGDQGARRAEKVDAEVLEEAPVLGRQRRLDQVVGQVLERNGIIVVHAALADLGAVAIEELDAVLAGRNLVLVELGQRRNGKRVHDEQAACAKCECLGGGFVQEFLPPGQAETGKKRRDAVPAVGQGLPGLGERGIDPGIDAEPIDQALAAALSEEPIVHASASLCRVLQSGCEATAAASISGNHQRRLYQLGSLSLLPRATRE